jgi:predicted nucleic acid-binding protein
VPVSRLTELEVENALQALCFRKQISAAQLAAARDLVAALHEEGRFRRLAVPLDRVAVDALDLAPVVTRRTGCRTLDLIHVATAKLLGSVEFVTTDQRQSEAARACGLDAVDPTSDR